MTPGPNALLIASLFTAAELPAAGEAAPAAPASPTAPAATAEPSVLGPSDAGILAAEPAAANVLDSKGEGIDEGADTFGFSLAGLGVEPTWSGYGDLIYTQPTGDDADPGTFDLTHFNPIIGARLGDRARTELELELEHGGSEIKVEYAFFDYEFVPGLSTRVGKFLVPIGRFNDVLHPSFRWPQITRPAMFRDVVPEVWSDVGAELFGDAELSSSTSIEWTVYAVNGLGGGKLAAIAANDEPIRKLRDNVVDQNADKGLGARFVLELFQDAEHGELAIALSGYTGALDPDGALRLTIADAALSSRLGPVHVEAEYAQSFLGPDDDAFQAHTHGVYLQAGVPVGPIEVIARWDQVLNRPGLGAAAWRRELVPTLKYAPQPFWSVRAEAQLPIVEEELGDPTWSGMVAFSF